MMKQLLFNLIKPSEHKQGLTSGQRSEILRALESAENELCFVYNVIGDYSNNAQLKEASSNHKLRTKFLKQLLVERKEV